MGCCGCRICIACRELSTVLRWGTELGNAGHFFPGGNENPPWGQISGGSRAGKHYIPQCLAGIWVEKIGNSLVLMVQWQVLQAMTEKLPLDFMLLRQGWCHVLPPCGFSLLLAPSWPFFLPFPSLLMSSPSAPLLSPYPSFVPAPWWRAEMGEGPACSSPRWVLCCSWWKERTHPKEN